jgi:hypothetical protein
MSKPDDKWLLDFANCVIGASIRKINAAQGEHELALTAQEVRDMLQEYITANHVEVRV